MTVQRLFIALGAGLAAAVLFVIPAKGTAIAMMMAFIAPLPIMIAALGFGHLTGLGAALFGSLLIGGLLHPLYALTFAATLALPSWWLSFLTLRSHPADEATPRQLVFFPLGGLLTWIAVIGAATAIGLILVIEASFGSYAAAVHELSGKLAVLLQGVFGDSDILPGGLSAEDFAALVIRAMPPVMAGWGVITFSLNLWLAARVVQISDRLPRPWAPLPENLHLPRLCATVLGLALVACLRPDDFTRLTAASIAAATAVAFALQGLAAIHAMTRGWKYRGPLLGGIYALTLALMPWPLVPAALVGVADAFFPSRGRRSPAPPSTVR